MQPSENLTITISTGYYNWQSLYKQGHIQLQDVKKYLYIYIWNFHEKVVLNYREKLSVFQSPHLTVLICLPLHQLIAGLRQQCDNLWYAYQLDWSEFRHLREISNVLKINKK
jgi:hypothetical protein